MNEEPDKSKPFFSPSTLRSEPSSRDLTRRQFRLLAFRLLFYGGAVMAFTALILERTINEAGLVLALLLWVAAAVVFVGSFLV